MNGGGQAICIIMFLVKWRQKWWKDRGTGMLTTSYGDAGVHLLLNTKIQNIFSYVGRELQVSLKGPPTLTVQYKEGKLN